MRTLLITTNKVISYPKKENKKFILKWRTIHYFKFEKYAETILLKE